MVTDVQREMAEIGSFWQCPCGDGALASLPRRSRGVIRNPPQRISEGKASDGGKLHGRLNLDQPRDRSDARP